MRANVVIALAGLLVCVGAFVLGRLTSVRSGNDHAPRSPSPSLVHFNPPKAANGTSALPEPTSDRLRELLASPRSKHRELAFRLGIESLAADQLEALWKFSRGHLNYGDEEDFNIAASILGRLAEIDAEAALVFAEQDGGAWKSQLQREVVGAWAQVDQTAALEWIASAGSGVRDRALRATLELLGDTDREAAVQLFRDMVAKGVVTEKAWGAIDFFNEWAKEDPNRAAEAALDHFKFTGRDPALGGVMKAWAVSDPHAGLSWLKANDESLSKPLLTGLTATLMGAWSNHSPKEAADYLLTIDDTNQLGKAAPGIFADWAGISFDDAAQWIANVDDPDLRASFEASLARGALNQGDRNDGIAYALEKFDTNAGMSHNLYLLVSDAVGDDIEGSVEWVKEIAPNELILEEFYNTLLHQWRWKDIGEAVKHLDLMPDPVRRGEDYEFFASQYAKRELNAARDWANNLPDSPDRDRALIGVADAWMDENPQQTAEWIETLEAGDLRDRVTSSYIGHIADKDIVTAAQMANELQDPFRRDDSLEYVMGKWLGQDRAVAEAAIRESDSLSDTARWRLLEGGDY